MSRKPREVIKIIRGDQIRLEPIDWLMKDRIASSGLTLIAGHGGIGKSLLFTMIAATVTIGGTLPGETAPTPVKNVAIFSGEEDLASILGPRLVVAGADMSKVHFLDEVESDRLSRPLDLKYDVDKIERALDEIGNVGLASIDPVTDFMLGLSSNDVTDVRSILTPIGKLARKARIPFMAATHLKKGASASVESVLGSGGFVNAARAVHIMERGEGNTRILRMVKTNLADQNLEAMVFSIEMGVTEEGITAPYLKWRGSTAIEDDVNSGALGQAMEAMKIILSEGGVPIDEFHKRCKEKGISKRTNERARSQLGVRIERRHVDGVIYPFMVLPHA